MNGQWTLGSWIAALLLVGCATGSPNDAADTQRDADLSVLDADSDAEDDAVVELDADDTDADVPSDAEADVDAANIDVTADTTPPDTGSGCEVVSDECVPESVLCDGSDVVFCGRCGSELRREPCASDEICEAVAGIGSCRPCVGEECPEVVDCEAGTRSCVSFNTQQICGPDGRVSNVVTCPAGRRCIGGGCVPEGADVGASCDVDADCSGQSCLCGEEYVARFGADDCVGIASGYCSTLACAESGCDPSDEACVFAPPFGASTGAPVCVDVDDCSVRGATCAAGVCEELPSGVGRDWPLSCWPDTPTIGEGCLSDEDCLGGDCRVKTVGGTTASYCVAPCGDDAGCPSHAECVEDIDRAGQFACFARNDAVSCPRSETQPILFGGSQPRRRFGGGVATVCYFR